MENLERIYSPVYPVGGNRFYRRMPARSALDRFIYTSAGQIIILFILGLFILLPITIAAGFLAYFQVFDRIAPGVSVGDVHLGSADLQNAAVRIYKYWNMDRRLLVGATVNGQVQTWRVGPSDLGLSVNAFETARNAYAVAHDQSWLNEIDQTLRSGAKGWGIAPVVVFDRDAARAGLEQLSAQISIAPIDASISIKNGQIVETAAVPGIRLDVERTLDLISADPLGVLLSGTLVLPVEPVYADGCDFSALKTEIERLMSAAATVSAYDPILDEWSAWTSHLIKRAASVGKYPGQAGILRLYYPESKGC